MNRRLLPFCYWSNCLVEALCAKLSDYDDVELKFIFTLFHFHVMWYDRHTDKVYHFTHKYQSGFHSDLWFKGNVEEISVEQFNEYCLKKNRKHLTIKKPNIIIKEYL